MAQAFEIALELRYGRIGIDSVRGRVIVVGESKVSGRVPGRTARQSRDTVDQCIVFSIDRQLPRCMAERDLAIESKTEVAVLAVRAKGKCKTTRSINRYGVVDQNRAHGIQSQH